MGFKSKRPPIRTVVNKDKYNLLISILKVNELSSSKKASDKAIKLKDKLLNYSRPFKDDNNNDMVEIRFFPDEINDLVHQFLFYNSTENIDTTYFETLLEYRKKYMEQAKK